MAASPHIALASRSPRRRELLRQIGIRFHCLAIQVCEQRKVGESPAAYVVRTALEKAQAGVIGEPELPILGADTAVVLDDAVFGKPCDHADAKRMLRALSGREHRVITAVAISHRGRTATRCQSSNVRLAPISDAMIDAYWATGEPADKAGAYAIQGLAAAFVERLEGSYSGVMGLPLYETVCLLRSFGVLAGGMVSPCDGLAEADP